MNRKIVAIGFMLVFLLVSFSGCNEFLGNNLDDRLVGSWTSNDDIKMTYTFFSDGTCSIPSGFNMVSCTYEIKDGYSL